MSTERSNQTFAPSRRSFLRTAAAACSAAAIGKWGHAAAATAAEPSSERGEPTRFQVACMTLPYGRFPLERALTGIKAAGYRYVAWGTRHVEAGGEQVPVLPADAPPAKAKELGKRCRDLGLEPLMMFSVVSAA